MIIVRLEGNEWRRLAGEPFEAMTFAATKEERYADGRIIEVACEPYPVAIMLQRKNIVDALATGAWQASDLAQYGLAIASEFKPEDGYRTTGPESFVEASGSIQQIFQVEKIPEPEPIPDIPKAERLRRMLADWGLTVEDLKALLANDP